MVSLFAPQLYLAIVLITNAAKEKMRQALPLNP